MAAKKGSPLGICLTTLFTSLLAPVLVNVVSGAIHPADSNTAPTKPALTAPVSAKEGDRGTGKAREELRRTSGQRSDWNRPWVSAAPAGSGG